MVALKSLQRQIHCGHLLADPPKCLLLLISEIINQRNMWRTQSELWKTLLRCEMRQQIFRLFSYWCDSSWKSQQEAYLVPLALIENFALMLELRDLIDSINEKVFGVDRSSVLVQSFHFCWFIRQFFFGIQNVFVNSNGCRFGCTPDLLVWRNTDRIILRGDRTKIRYYALVFKHNFWLNLCYWRERSVDNG